MTDVANKQQLTDVTRASRAALASEIAPLSDAQLVESGVTDGWSIKDSLAHISAWERMFISWIDALMRGERPDRPANITEDWVNETNARIHAERRDDSLEDVRDESRASHEAILALIDRLSEDELFDPQHFPWMRSRDLAPWLRGNADEHYDEHREHIAAWRAKARSKLMDDAARAFLEKNRSAAMTTLRRDGTPHTVRIGLALVEGKIWASGTRDRLRTKHLRRDPRSTLFVFDPVWAYLTLECRTTILEGPDVPDLSVRLFQVMQREMPNRPPEGQIAWYGKPLSIDEFKQAMRDERRIIYEFEVLRSYGLYTPPSGT